jgi:hypothetical protein
VGRPTEILLRSLAPRSFGFGKPTRIIQAGEAAGARLTVAAESLRTSGAEIYGLAKGLDAEKMRTAYAQVVEWARDGRLTFDVERMPLGEIEAAWQRTDLRGRRLVIIP